MITHLEYTNSFKNFSSKKKKKKKTVSRIMKYIKGKTLCEDNFPHLSCVVVYKK